MTNLTLKHALIGFVAGAIATVTVHELINYALLQAGVFPRQPWSMTPAAMTGVPQIVSDAFWGGVWGVIFAALYDALPGDGATLKGLIFGVLGPALIGVFILVPLLTGRFPPFFGGDPALIGSVLLILAGSAAAMGWLYGMMAKTA